MTYQCNERHAHVGSQILAGRIYEGKADMSANQKQQGNKRPEAVTGGAHLMRNFHLLGFVYLVAPARLIAIEQAFY